MAKILSSTDAPIGLLASGGLDSSILLGRLLERGQRVRPIYVCFGVAWQEPELAALRAYLAALGGQRLEPLLVLDMPIADLYGDHWSVTGRGVPDAHTSDEAVYLPGRNLLLIVKVAVWCRLHGIRQLALAPLCSNPFPDATSEFFADLESALNREVANRETAVPETGGRVSLVRPFAKLTKREVMQMGRCYPLHLTFSCIDPRGGTHCGACNKCAERQEAFRLSGEADPTLYAELAAPSR